MSRAIRAALAAAPLLVMASACEMGIDIRTTVNDSGGGRFSIAVAMDEDFVSGLETFKGGGTSGDEVISLLDRYFDCLRTQRWDTDRSTPDKGILLTASRRFRDERSFDEVLASLRCGTDARGAADLSNLGVNLDYGVSRSFLRTRGFFRGEVNLGKGLPIDPKALDALRNLDQIRVRIIADLPGAVSVEQGGGTVQGGAAVWQPALGELLEFEARSSSLRSGPLLLLALPAVLAVGALLWVLAGRRRAPPELPTALAPGTGGAESGAPPA